MRKLLSICFLLVSVSMHAQIFYWALHPDFDSIEAVDKGVYVVEKNGKFGLMGDNDQVILKIEYDRIGPFREGVALLLTKDGVLQGYTDTKGNVFPITNRKFTVNEDFPYFSNNHLLVKEDDKYFFIKKDSDKLVGPFYMAYPFFEGYASVKPFKNIMKGYEPDDTYRLLCQDGESRFYSFGTMLDDEINFVSSANNGKILISWKKKFYLYNLNTQEIEELYILDQKNRKQAVAAIDKNVLPDMSGVEVRSLAVKNANFTFDQYLRLIDINYGDNKERVSFIIPKPQQEVPNSILKLVQDNGKKGISLNNDTILPPQFSSAELVNEDAAIVSNNEKFGVVHLKADDSFKFVLNDNDIMNFNHGTYDTKVSLTMPAYIDCEKTVLQSVSEKLLLKDNERTDKPNKAVGNTIDQGCKVNMPDEITNKPAGYNYYFSIRYDNLVSKNYPVTAQEWYSWDYEVELSNMDNISKYYNAKDSLLIGEFRIVNGSNQNVNYPKEVSVGSEMAENAEVEKVNENYYRFKLLGVGRGDIFFSVLLNEIGCPLLSFDFAISTAAKSEEKQVRRSTGQVATPKPKPQPKPRPFNMN